MTIKKIVFGVLVMFVVLAPASLAFAADPVPLNFSPPCIPVQGISGLDTCASPLTSASTIQDYIIRLYQFSVGISGIVAVGMIVWGAIKISAFTESITQKGEGREMITNAIIGIVLLLGSYLILRTVNPRIVSLGEMLSPATVPQNTTATTSIATAPESCGDASAIPGVEGVPIGNVKPDDGGNTCKYRKLFLYKDGFHIVPDNDFYMSSTNIDIKPRSVIWTYPYFVKGKGAASARCVVYAYREPGNAGATFSSLEPGIETCVLTGKQLDGYTGGPGDASSTQTGTVPADVQALAKELLFNRKFLSFDDNADCNPKPDTSGAGAMRYMKDGQTPYICYSGCRANPTKLCEKTGVFPNKGMLNAIDAVSGMGKNITVTSLTGGDHSSSSKHYTGNAFDMTVANKTKADYNDVINFLNSSGVTGHCEYQFGGSTKFLSACGDEAFSSGASNLHIHAEN